MKRSLILAAFFCLAAAPALGAGPNMSEGQWEVTSRVDIPGLPFPMPPVKATICLTARDSVPQKPEKDQECRNISTEVKGDTVSWVTECTDRNGTTRSTGSVTYKKESFDGTMTVVGVPPKAREGLVTMKMSGRRIGPCP